eukprot:7386991-Prymnesium_polylepis.2
MHERMRNRPKAAKQRMSAKSSFGTPARLHLHVLFDPRPRIAGGIGCEVQPTRITHTNWPCTKHRIAG